MQFEILATSPHSKARAGLLHTPHGTIETPGFIGVATQGTIKGVTVDQLQETAIQLLIANTYHLYLRPGDEVVRDAGGLHQFMGWNGPLMTDSGGFQVFSLGAAFGKNLTKVAHEDIEQVKDERRPSVYDPDILTQHGRLAIIDEEGVTFTSHLDGSLHRFTPERSIEIQHNLGADIIIAFDECTAATADWRYQKEAMERTHRWADRSLKAHRRNIEANRSQALFGVVQGGRFEDLRRESARILSEMHFDGFGIGGSYVKEDLDTAVGWVTDELPDGKPRHLLGIGEPEDLMSGIEKGVDLFDCVQPTRLARTGMVYGSGGVKMNLLNEKYRRDFSVIDESCACPVCAQKTLKRNEARQGYTRAYLAHLFHAREILGATLASIHNIYFLVDLVRRQREALLNSEY